MFIKSASRWRNNKTQDVYHFWYIATDLNGAEYVIYSLKPLINKCGFLVKNSENLLIGKCELLPSNNSEPGSNIFNWVVTFENKLNDSHSVRIDV
jgi:hypothetical protein